jgi:hypothetical protein
MSELIRREDVQREIQTSFDEGAFRWQDGQDLMDRISALPTASPWHRVEEPPKEHMWCFVYTDEPEMIMPIRIAFYVASCTGKGSWYHYESGGDIDDEVDYWTPMYLEGPKLPWPIEPPEVEKDRQPKSIGGRT